MAYEDQSQIVRFLARPESYGDTLDAVQTLETHASIIFLAGDFAYKLKRAVRYTYLDYSTLERRQRACEAEVALNRRTAASLYLCAKAILRAPDGRLSFVGPGEPVDWVVVMRRFPQDALFTHLADRGKLTTPLARELADRIAAFHAVAGLEPGQGGAAGAAAVIQINDENLRRSPPLGVSTADIDRLRDASLTALGKCAALLDLRRAKGRVRRCHGDLHLSNICLIDGQPTLFDCIEFSDLISCIDVLYDLAFLLMDMRHRGLDQQCGVVFNRYLDLTRDDDGIAAVPLFMSLRASVRAHVTAAVPAGPEARGTLAEARSYYDLAVNLLRLGQARLVAIGGLSGTGKSSIAAAIAGELGIGAGARVLRSDVVRKQLFGKSPEERLPEAGYTEEVNHKVYAALESRAAALLAAGCSVVIDSVAAKPEERAAMAELARRAGVEFSGIWLQASKASLLHRLARRGKDASDATATVLQKQLTYDLGKIDWVCVDTDWPESNVMETVRKSLFERSSQAARLR